jgi:hypothetical protein
MVDDANAILIQPRQDLADRDVGVVLILDLRECLCKLAKSQLVDFLGR